jgi:peptidoglycan/LPS O-acetylase OafA/YrhL
MGRFLNAGSVPTLAGSQLPGQLLFTAVTGSVTVAAAVLSWHFYEARFLKWKALFH